VVYIVFKSVIKLAEITKIASCYTVCNLEVGC